MSLANYCTAPPLPPPPLLPNPGAGALNSASGAEVALSSGPRGASDSPRLVNFLLSHWPERPVASSPLPGEKKKNHSIVTFIYLFIHKLT